MEDKIRQMMNSEQRLGEGSLQLRQPYFRTQQQRVDEQNRQSLHGLLTPLRERLDRFRRQVQETLARRRHCAGIPWRMRSAICSS